MFVFARWIVRHPIAVIAVVAIAGVVISSAHEKTHEPSAWAPDAPAQTGAQKSLNSAADILTGGKIKTIDTSKLSKGIAGLTGTTEVVTNSWDKTADGVAKTTTK